MNYSRIYIFLFFAIVSIGIYIVYNYLNKDNIEGFNNIDNVYYLEKNETAKFLLLDSDNYVKNMSEIDLYARKVSDRNEYINKVSKNAMSFNIEEKEKLLRCSKMADSFLRLYKNQYINSKDMISIKWKFALVSNTLDKKNIEYEDGLPHTREDIIFLSKYVLNNNDIDLTNVLIHEKVHIYQRYNKDVVDKIIKDLGYMYSRKNEHKLKRSNPDINDDIYINPMNNKEMYSLYRSEKPNNISDTIINNFTTEHPYEVMAYNIADEYNKNYINKYKSQNI